MSTEISYFFGKTGVNGEYVGEKDISLFPLVNSVITSDVLIINTNKTPKSLSSSYIITYDNPELGFVIDKDGSVRSEILELNNQKSYRYLVQDSTGSNFPTGSARESTPTASLGPLSYTGLQLWLDANDITTITTSSGTNTITAWTNKSQVSKTITLGGSPKLITSSLNGRSGVRFTTSDYLRETSNYPAPVTVMYVGRLTGGANGRFITAISNNWLLGTHGGTINDGYFEGWVYDSPTTADTTARLWSATIGGSGVNSVIYSNTSSLASNQNGVTGPNGISVNQSPYGEQSNCELYELIIYNRTISSDERDNLFTYFYNKWGVAAKVGPGVIQYTVQITGSTYLNNNIVNIRFINGDLSGSNLSNWIFNISASLTSSFLSGSQDIIVTNITKSVNNEVINKISTGSSVIKRNDGISNNTIYTGDYYFADTTNVGNFNVDRIIIKGSNTTITTNVEDFVPTINKQKVFEIEYNTMCNVNIDSVYTIVDTDPLPQGFYLTNNNRNLTGYVNFTKEKIIKLKLSDNTIYNVIIKPIVFKSKLKYNKS